jgi:RNA polymerase sigma factor (sigma-70 family)
MNALMRKKKLSEFFLAEREKLVRYARKLIDDASDRDAEDIVQDIIVNLFDKADVTIPIENLAAYVYRSLKNKIVDIFRKKNKTSHISLDVDVIDDSGISLAELIQDARDHTESEEEKKELYTQLYGAIDSLNPNEQAVVIATEFDGTSFGELSKMWGVPVGTLLARKARAIKKIRGKFQTWIKEE